MTIKSHVPDSPFKTKIKVVHQTLKHPKHFSFDFLCPNGVGFICITKETFYEIISLIFTYILANLNRKVLLQSLFSI